MARISTDQQVVTLINVFTVAPEHQQRLIDLLVEATEQVISRLPGYVSANIHRGLDGTRVVNYAQWRSVADFEAMLRHPEARPHFEAAWRLATNEPHLYEVVYTHSAAG
jgi:heme-degrading monooxygenase HmoA